MNATETAARHDGADVGGRAEASRSREGAARRRAPTSARKSGGAGLPRNYMANRVNTARGRAARSDRRERAAAAGRTYEEQLAIEQKPVARSAVSAASRRRSVRTVSRCRRQGGAGAPQRRTAPADAPPAATPPAAPAPPLNRRPAAGRGRARPGADAGAQGRAGGAAAAAPIDDDDNEVVVAGLVGSGGGGLTPLVFAAREGDIESAQAAARRRRRRQSGHRVRLDAAADRGQQPQLPARRVAARARRRRQPRQQGRLDAALPGDRQPQHRRRRLSGAEAGHGSPRVHQAAARQGRQPERAGQGQHADAHDLHDAVVLRGRRHAVHPRRAVERHRADEAAARSTAPIRRSRPTIGDTR